MPSFPQPGALTLCEINRDLITVEVLSDDHAKEAYGKILGKVFSPISYPVEHLVASDGDVEVPVSGLSKLLKAVSFGPMKSLIGFNDGKVFSPISYPVEHLVASDGDGDVEVPVSGLSKLLKAVSFGPMKSLIGFNDVKLLPHVDLRRLSWNSKKDILAFVMAENQIAIRNYKDSGEGKDPCILMNDLQREVKLLEWRPNAGRTLSVACKGGICIWTASYPGNTACVRPGLNSSSLSRGSGVRWTLVDFLRSHDDVQISALSWSPDGRYPN